MILNAAVVVNEFVACTKLEHIPLALLLVKRSETRVVIQTITKPLQRPVIKRAMSIGVKDCAVYPRIPAMK